MFDENDSTDIVHDSRNVESSRNPLTNADFRKLIQNSRTSSSTGGDHETKNDESVGHSFTHRSSRNVDSSKIHHKRLSSSNNNNNNDNININDKKLNAAVASAGPKIRTEEDELNDILKKYRDRAKERREGEVRESEQELDLIKAGGYRAVAPDIRINLNLAEKRKKIIEESKYLGGDMEHTHLVKGLDYALLQKVRSEILSKEKESDDLEKVYQAKRQEQNQVENEIKSNLARSIYNTLFKKQQDLQNEKIVNELFAPRRMAYVIEMDDEYSDDVPTVLIRSKQDCPVDETSTNLSINDMVIQKLTQVLSYLRADNKKKKKGKDKISEEERTKAAGQNIYDDVGVYVPNLTKNQQSSSSKKLEYFPKIEKSVPKIPEKQPTTIQEPILEQKKSKPAAKKDQLLDSYAECYPGGMECYDAAGDSDDDADFSKMDLGNKKGPIRRWDFDTEQEYEDWMSNREALPKAAFQYGVKMLDGRKTRKLPGPRSEKDEKAKIDRQWAKISKILDKRKQDGENDVVESKKSKI
uniref:Protein Red n=1 Tax=Romanomermis culicivorax TaxID=13658 RepID=A0A915HIK0_ROMCU